MTDASGKALRDTNDQADVIDAGPVTSQEAREIASRFINSHFNNPGEKARISIPADPLRDDDIRLIAHIKQSAAEIERLREVIMNTHNLSDELDRFIDADAKFRAELKAKGFLDDAGNVRRVLGQLPLTADGCVIGMGAVCHSGLIPGLAETTHKNTLWVDEEIGKPPPCGIIVTARPGLGWWSTKELADECYKRHGDLRDEIAAESARAAAEEGRAK